MFKSKSLFKAIAKPITAPIGAIKDAKELVELEHDALAVAKEVKGKQFWKSKTFWFNALTLAAFLLGHGYIPVTPEQMVYVMGIINLFLRFLTNEPVRLSAAKVEVVAEARPEDSHQ